MQAKTIFKDIGAIEKRLEGLLRERELLLKENRKLRKDREQVRERLQRLMTAVEEEMEKTRTSASPRKRGRKKKGTEN